MAEGEGERGEGEGFERGVWGVLAVEDSSSFRRERRLVGEEEEQEPGQETGLLQEEVG